MRRPIAPILSLGGAIAILGGAALPWRRCPVTPCEGALQAFSEVAGTEMIGGLVTVVAGLLLAGLALLAMTRPVTLTVRRVAITAALLPLAAVVLQAALSSGTWRPGTFPAEGVVLVGLGSVVGAAACRRWTTARTAGHGG